MVSFQFVNQFCQTEQNSKCLILQVILAPLFAQSVFLKQNPVRDSHSLPLTQVMPPQYLPDRQAHYEMQIQSSKYGNQQQTIPTHSKQNSMNQLIKREQPRSRQHQLYDNRVDRVENRLRGSLNTIIPPLPSGFEVMRTIIPGSNHMQSQNQSNQIISNNIDTHKIQQRQQNHADSSTKYVTLGSHGNSHVQQSLGSFDGQSNSKEKLFTREFYNLQRSNKKRDIESVSLHKHPKSHLHGIFDKWRVQNSLEEMGGKPPLPMSPREYQQAYRSVDHGQSAIPLRHLAKYNIGMSQDHHNTSTISELPYIHTVDSSQERHDPYANTQQVDNMDKEVNISNLNLTIQHPPNALNSQYSRRSQNSKESTSQRSMNLKLQERPSVHSLNRKTLIKLTSPKGDQQGSNRLLNDFHLYKSVENQVYGLNAKQDERRLVNKVNRSSVRDTRIDSSTQQQQSHASIHPLSHSEVNVNYFARNQPAFMNDEDRKKSLQKSKPIIGKSQLLSKAIAGHNAKQNNTAATPGRRMGAISMKPQLEKTFTDNSIIYQDQSEVQFDTNVSKNVADGLNNSSIRDMDGFYMKTESKLNSMLNHDSTTVFDTEQSRYLYKIITEKAMEIYRKDEEHSKFTQKKNRQYECSPLKQKKTQKIVQEGYMQKSSMKNRKSFKGSKRAAAQRSQNSTPSMRSQMGSAKSIQSNRSRSPSKARISIIQQYGEDKEDSAFFKDGDLEVKTIEEEQNSQIRGSPRNKSRSNSRAGSAKQLTEVAKPVTGHRFDSANSSSNQITSNRGARVKNRSLIRKNFQTLRSVHGPVNEAELVKNYFEMKGKIGPDEVDDHFATDIFHQLNMADKVGVYSALQNVSFDANSQLLRDKLYGVQTEFPGYEDQVKKVGENLQSARNRILKKEYNSSLEALGEERSQFQFLSSYKHDLTEILKKVNNAQLKVRILDVIQEVIKDDHQKGVKAMIVQQKLKIENKIDGTEEKLTKYIKYLVGEQRNSQFKFKREDFAQKHELNQKSLKLPFEEYAQQEENAMKTVANDIIERVDYNTVIQHSSDPASIVTYESNPKFAYFNICTKDCDLAIPLLAKVVNQQLSLMNYQLSLGHVKAFCRTFDFNKDFVSKFLFDNCGMTDAHNEILFNAANKLEKVSDLIIKRNEFGQRSVMAIKSLLEKPKPYNLSTLRIVNCKIAPQHTRDLIKMIRQSNNLKVLGLVNARIDDVSMAELGMVLQESHRLQELDISWNNLKPQSYLNLIIGLGSNKTLVSLNLSWNQIFEETEIFIKEDEKEKEKEKKLDSSAGFESTRPSGPKLWQDEEVKFTAFSTQAIDKVCHLLKRNKRLQHVNLNQTGLTEFMIVKIAKAMRRAKALCSIHLDGNRGVTARLKDFMHSHIRCMANKAHKNFKIEEMISIQRTETEMEILQRQLTQNAEQVGEKPIARETIKIKQIFNRKRIHSLINDFAEDPDQETAKLTCTRILGHKTDMPGSGQWKMINDKSDECWICDQQVYSLVFWDAEHIAKRAYLSTEDRYQAHLMKLILTELYKHTPKEAEDELAAKYPNAPIIYGDFTNWEPKPLMDVCELAEKFHPQFTEEKIFQSMKDDRLMGYDQTALKEFQIPNFKKYVREFFEYEIDLNWKEVLERYLPYKKPHMVFAANTREDFYKNLFVFASMFKVGNHEFIIRSAGPEKPKYYYYSSVSDIRAEDLHHFVKTSQHTEHRRIFDKENSVFAPWKEDTKQSLSQSLIADSLYWKINNVIKDEKDYKDVLELFKDNMALLKDVYLNVQTNSAYPFVQMVELGVMCREAKLIDQRLNVANIDLLYFSTYEKKTMGQVKGKSGLMRCEFLEFILRLAKFKLVETKICTTYKEALHIIITDHLKKYYSPQPWQQFRDQQLWDFPVNNVLKENMEAINKLHKFYDTPQQKFMSFKDAMNMMCKDTKLNFSSKQAKYCIGFCKMTVMDETMEFNAYNKIQHVELLEMIGRMAHIKYAGTSLDEEPLHIRMEYILDELFKLIGANRKEVPIEEESESDSDDDY